MRNHRWITCSLLAIVLLGWGVSQLVASSQRPVEPVAAETLRLAFVCGDQLTGATVSEYWQKAIDGIRAAEQDLDISISLLAPVVGSAYDTIGDVYDSAILSQMDGILCVGVDQEDLVDRINRAADAGIPTVCIDGDVPQSRRIAYIGTDNDQAGRDAAQELLRRLDRVGSVCIFYPLQTTAQFEDRVQGFSEVIKAAEGYSVVHKNAYKNVSTNVEYMNLTRQIFRNNHDIVAVFCPGTDLVASAAKTLREMGMKEDLFVMCMEDDSSILAAIERGDIDAALVQRPYKMGYDAVTYLYHYLVNGASDAAPETFYLDTYWIDARNIAQYQQ